MTNEMLTERERQEVDPSLARILKALGRRQDTARPLTVSPEVFLPRFDANGNLEPPGKEWPEVAVLERMKLTGLLRELLSCMDDDVRGAYLLCDLVGQKPGDEAAILHTRPQAVARNHNAAGQMSRGFPHPFCTCGQAGLRAAPQAPPVSPPPRQHAQRLVGHADFD